jgi:3-oxoacyl-[acyl-carrier-protein] synthase I
MSRSTPLHVVACGMCCSAGHYTDASVAVLRGRINQFRQTAFLDESGIPIVGASISGVDVWGEARLRIMLQAALLECKSQLASDWRPASIALVLLLDAELHSDARHLWLETILPSPESGQETVFHPASTLVLSGKGGIADAVALADQILAAKSNAPKHVMIAATDSLLTAPQIQRHLSAERIKSTENPDGFIPGEGAGAIVLTRTGSLGSQLVIEGWAATEDAPLRSSTSPTRAVALTHAIRQAARMAGREISHARFQVSGANGESWYFKESALAISRCLERRVERFDHHFASRSLGETGVSCGPLTLAWMSRAMGTPDGPGSVGIAHFADEAGRRSALVLSRPAFTVQD